MEASLSNPKSPMYTEPNSLNSHHLPEPLQRAHQVYSRILSITLSHGTTTASYFATISVPATNLLAELAFKRGQRAYIGRVCMDNPTTCPSYYIDSSTEITIKHTLSTIQHCHQLDPTATLIAPIITPRFAPSCTQTTLTALGDLAKSHSLRIQTHISENKNECTLVSELFPQHESYAHVYDAAGLLTPRTILAHAVHLNDHEIKRIKAQSAKISHCPASNSALGSGFCAVRTLINAGIDVGLGTDVSGGYSPSILEAVRQTCLVSRHVGFLNDGDSSFNIGVGEGLYLATVGGAKVVGMEGKLGLFEEGALWDVQEIELGVVNGEGEIDGGGGGGVDVFGWESWEDRVAKWLWNGDDRNVRRVWVGGRLVHERR
jgi:guanine deaminase